MAREGGIIRWQWQGYDRNHRDRANLLLHIVFVPFFIAGVCAALVLLWQGHFAGAAVAALVAVAAFALQGVGHRREMHPPVPFDDAGDFVARLFAEQFVTFPRFVLSGGWLKNLLRVNDRHVRSHDG